MRASVRHIALLAVLIDLFCLPTLAGAQADSPPCQPSDVSGGELSLARAVNLALCNNADIQSAAAAVRVRAAQLGEAHSEYWPSLSGSATELHERTGYPGSPTPATSDTAVTLYGTLTWRLFDFGGRRADSRAASELLEAALATQDATAQKVLGSVVQAYFDAVAAGALLTSKTEDETVAQETQASAARRLQQGEGAQSDTLQAATALARARLDVSRARSLYEKSLAVLQYSVGLPPEASIDVPDEVKGTTAADQKSLAAWLEEARAQHPAIVAARTEVEAARSQVRSARSSGRPTIDLQVNYYANGFPQQGLANARLRSTTAGISINIPLFDGFLNRYKVHEAEANVDLKQAVLVDTERLTLTEIIKAYADASSAASNLQQSQALLESAQASQASSKRRYESGATDILELLSAQAALADAREERVRSLADWRSSRLRLLATSGVLRTVSP